MSTTYVFEKWKNHWSDDATEPDIPRLLRRIDGRTREETSRPIERQIVVVTRRRPRVGEGRAAQLVGASGWIDVL